MVANIMRYFLIFIMTLCSSLLSAAPTSSIDLIALYKQAMLFDPVFAQAQAQWLSAQQDYPIARAHLRPNINASLSYTHAETQNKGGLSNFIQGGTTNDRGYAVTLSQPCLLYTSPSPRDKRQSRMPSSA